MIGELLLRFLLGGIIVSAFAVISDIVQPKTYGGTFGGAPSVALASLGLTFAIQGGRVAALDGRSMLAGAVALFGYSVAAKYLIMHRRWRAPIAASVLWLVWLAIAFALWAVVLR
jgi:hypothetical protein